MNELARPLQVVIHIRHHGAVMVSPVVGRIRHCGTGSIKNKSGAGFGTLSCKELAAGVTQVGRSLLTNAKKFVESNIPGSRVVYGDTDSVFVEIKDTKISIRQ